MGRIYYKVNEAVYSNKAKAWLKSNPKRSFWVAVSYVFYVLGVLCVPGCALGLGDDTISMVMGGLVGLIAGTIVACIGAMAYKFSTAAYGGQLYYMHDLQISMDDQHLMVAYHPYLDRQDYRSTGVNIIPFDKIERITVDKRFDLITVEGAATFEMYQTALGNQYLSEGSSLKHQKWADFRFFMCLDDEEAFWSNLKSHGVKIESV